MPITCVTNIPILCIGTKEEMLSREKDYINGTYVPFETPDKGIICCNLGVGCNS